MPKLKIAIATPSSDAADKIVKAFNDLQLDSSCIQDNIHVAGKNVSFSVESAKKFSLMDLKDLSDEINAKRLEVAAGSDSLWFYIILK